MYAAVVETFVQGVLQFYLPDFLNHSLWDFLFPSFSPSIHLRAVLIFSPYYMPANHEEYVNKTQLIFRHTLWAKLTYFVWKMKLIIF